MQIKRRSFMVPGQPTSTGPAKYELTLNATGTASEIKWLEEQLDKLGKNNG